MKYDKINPNRVVTTGVLGQLKMTFYKFINKIGKKNRGY